MKLTDFTRFGSPLDWLIAAVVTVVVYFLLLSVRYGLEKYFSAAARRKGKDDGDSVGYAIVRRSVSFVFVVVAAYAGYYLLDFPQKIDAIVNKTALSIVLFQFGLWGSAAVRHWTAHRTRRTLEKDPSRVSAMGIISFVLKASVWLLVLLLILDNLGVNITAFVAGLGVGGIAIALAVQNILGDLLASVSIALDKPFEVGDFIIVEDFMGTVEEIGVKTCRLRSLGGEQIIFPNGDLLNSRIRNYKRMQQRRVRFSFGVVYNTPYEKLAAIPGIVREIIENTEGARFERAHFAKYGDFSLDFEVVYYVLSPDYNIFMDKQQEINLALFKRFEEEGIEFAFPTRTVYLAREAQKTENA